MLDTADSHPGEIVSNGFAISNNPEDRKPLALGQFSCRVTVRQIHHLAIKSGPDDDLADFAPL